MDDLHHLNKQMTKAQVDADKARSRANLERQRAYQYQQAGNDGQFLFHMGAAEKFEQNALELEQQKVDAENRSQSVQAEIADLEARRDMLDSEHERQKSELTKEIDRRKGTSLGF